MRGLRSIVAVVLAIVMTGCHQRGPDGILVHGMRVNGYTFDYVLDLPSSIQADSHDVHIKTRTTSIEVVDGTLRVDGRSYGAVKPDDRITVDADKVSVNGEERKKSDG